MANERTTELATRPTTAVVQNPSNMLEAVMQAMRDPALDPGRLREFLEIGERLEARQAKHQFDAAIHDMQAELPVITKRGMIIYKQGVKGTSFAKWDDIHKACMPILDKHGFSCSFTSDLQGTNALRVTIRVKGWGHEEQGSLVVPWLDTGGSKSPAQQAASSFTLAERHVFVKFFNILTEDADDDGSGRGVPDRITEEQARNIEDILSCCEEKETAFTSRFVRWMVAEIRAHTVRELFQGEQLDAVMVKLRAKMASLGI